MCPEICLFFLFNTAMVSFTVRIDPCSVINGCGKYSVITGHNITYSFITVKTERSTLQYNLSRRTATTRLSPKAARHRRRPGVANIRSGGRSPRKHSPDGAMAHIRLNGPASHLSTSEG